MSHTKRNLMVAYICLVGLPLLALVGVLKKGHALAAPFAVDGVWIMETEAIHLSALPCGNFLSSVTNAPVLISQSGKTLVLTLNGGSMSTASVLEVETIKASFTPTGSSTEADCSVDRTFTLTATLDHKSNPRTLIGTLAVDGCARCKPVKFRAASQPGTSREGER